MLKQRLVTAIVLLVVALFALFFATPLVWQALVAVLAAIAAWEWSQFARIKRSLVKVGFVVITLASLLLMLVADLQAWLVGLAIMQLVIVIYSVTRFQLTGGQPLLQQPFINLFVGLVFIVSFSMALVWMRDVYPVELLLLSMVMIWLVDTELILRVAGLVSIN